MSVTAGSSDRLISVSLALASSIAAAIVAAGAAASVEIVAAVIADDATDRISTFFSPLAC